jgi:non-ribosomal peptide synthetase component F
VDFDLSLCTDNLITQTPSRNDPTVDTGGYAAGGNWITCAPAIQWYQWNLFLF